MDKFAYINIVDWVAYGIPLAHKRYTDVQALLWGLQLRMLPWTSFSLPQTSILFEYFYFKMKGFST